MTGAAKGAVLMAVILTIGIVVGIGIGRKLYAPKPAPPETYARAQRQADGSLILEKKPQPDAKPAHQIPKGAKVERIVQFTVEPFHGAPAEVLLPTSGSAPEADALLPMNLLATNPNPCPPVRMDLTVIRLSDLQSRVIVSSPDGRVSEGVDISVEAAPIPKELKWAAGAIWGRTSEGDKHIGAFIDRDFSILRTGAEVTRVTYATTPRIGWDTRVKLGFRF